MSIPSREELFSSVLILSLCLIIACEVIYLMCVLCGYFQEKDGDRSERELQKGVEEHGGKGVSELYAKGAVKEDKADD